MDQKFFADSHTHSEHSFDGSEKVRSLASAAEKKGLYAITISDHCECHEYFEKNVACDISASAEDIITIRDEFEGRLIIRTGIELGQPTQDVKAAKDALSLAHYDFVLGSLHNLRGEQDFYFLRYPDAAAAQDLMDRYMTELYELAEQDLFDSLAHIDYPLRYMKGEAGLEIKMSDYQEKLDAVLELLVRNDKALEINTSGLRQKIGRTLPDKTVLMRYRELGGKLVTVGSDAHNAADVGSGIEQAYELLKECGYDSAVFFTDRKPTLLPV